MVEQGKLSQESRDGEGLQGKTLGTSLLGAGGVKEEEAVRQVGSEIGL